MSNHAEDVQLTVRDSGIEFSVKVVPGSSRSRIAGVWGTALRVAVAAPPEGGRANTQVICLLARAFGVSRGAVAITHGLTRPLKRVRVTGLSGEQARRLLAVALPGAH
jgi:uncharacterized protein (TIGR00251 family)